MLRMTLVSAIIVVMGAINPLASGCEDAVEILGTVTKIERGGFYSKVHIAESTAVYTVDNRNISGDCGNGSKLKRIGLTTSCY